MTYPQTQDWSSMSQFPQETQVDHEEGWKYAFTHPLDAFLDFLEDVGRQILAYRAKQVFGRVFGPSHVTVIPSRVPEYVRWTNHVQIAVSGYPEVVVVLFATVNDNEFFQFLTGQIHIGLICKKCRSDVAESRYTHRGRRSLRAAVDQLYSGLKGHRCA